MPATKYTLPRWMKIGFTNRLVLSLLTGVAVLAATLVGCGGGSSSGGAKSNPLMFLLGSTSLPAATVGVAYSVSVGASGGTAPYTFSLSSGSLPAGLTLSSSGTFSGTPAAAGSFPITVQVADSAGATATGSTTLVVNALPLAVTTTSLPAATLGAGYSATLAASGGVAPITFAVTAGTLPAGITLSSAGVFSGTPTATGSAAFTVTATDSAMKTATAALTLLVNAPPLVVTTATLPAGVVGTAYAATLTASGGVAPYTFSITGGTLPAGLTLSPAGALSGTPSAAGSAALTVTVTDSAKTTASAMLTLVVSPSPLSFSPASTLGEQANLAFSTTLTVSGGTSPYHFAVTSGSLPAGVTLSPSGVLAGTPAATGTFAVSVTVTDSSTPQESASAPVTLNIYNATVQVDAAKVLATVPATAYGLHTSVYDSGLADTAGLPAALSTDGIGVLRYPGGLYADNYHWAQYSMTPFTPPASNTACGMTGVTNGYLAGDTDFGRFVATLQATKTQALITINYGTSLANSTGSKVATNNGNCSEPNTSGQYQEAAAWVAYANGSATSTQSIGVDAVGFDWKTVGFWAGLRGASPLATDDGYNFLRIGQTAPLGIKYWELGNEIFYNGYPDCTNSETDLHAPYIYSSSNDCSGKPYQTRVGVSAISPTSYGTNVIPYISAMKAVDPTIQVGLVLSSPNVDPIPASWNPAAIQAVCAGSMFDFGIFHYYPGSYLAATGAQLLSLPQRDLPNLVTNAKAQIAKYCAAPATPVQFFVTETAPNFGLASGTPDQVTGLYATNVYLSALQSGIANVDWLEMHNGPEYLTDSNGTETPGNAYFGIELAHLLAGVGDSLVQATSSANQVVSYASVKAAGGSGVLLINANSSTPQTVLVTVSGASVSGTATQYSFGVGTTQSSSALSGTTFAVSGSTFLVTVPAYTATTVILP